MLTAPIALQAPALLPELAEETALTRRMLERAPEAHYAWQPHPKSMTLGRLTAHISSLLGGVSVTMKTDELDLMTDQAAFEPAQDTATLLQEFDANVAAAHEALTEVEDEAFAAIWTLRSGDQLILSQSRAAVIRHLISHMAHHRGQLSVYLRLLDVPVPVVYGPTADESH